MFFNSTGKYSFEEMLVKIEEFIFENKVEDGNEVKLIIGTDSQRVGSQKFVFAMAVALHAVGKGGTFFIKRERVEGYMHLSDRLFKEATMSLELAQKLAGNTFIDTIDGLEIHADVGYGGKSRDYAAAIKAMIEGYGFVGCIKPDAAVATHIADHFVR